MTPAAGPARRLNPFAWRVGVRDPVQLALVLAAAVAMVTTGFAAVAPNRLVSGVPFSLFGAVSGGYSIAVIIITGTLLLLSLSRPVPAVCVIAAVLASAWLLITLAALGAAGHRLAAGAGSAARVSAATAFWISAGCAGLAIVNALQRLRAGPVITTGTVAAIGLATIALCQTGAFDQLAIAREYATRRALFDAALTRHVTLVAASVGPALLIGFPLGLAAVRKPRIQGPLFATLNLMQTVPSIALFGLLIVPLSALAAAIPRIGALGVGGIGPAPAIIALVLYALLPIVRNTAIGISGVDAAVIEAARGMGMTRRQIFRRIELPLALPILIAGLRIVIVQTIGLAVVAALIGAGGLGTFVFEGLGQYALDLVLLGALPTIGLALAADLAMNLIAALLGRQRIG